MREETDFWTMGMKIFAVVAAIWAGLWWMGAGMAFSWSSSSSAEADFLSRPTTGVDPGADLLATGVVDGPTQPSPLAKRDCVASLTDVRYVYSYIDSEDRRQTGSRVIATFRTGPSRVPIAVGSERVMLPLARWSMKGLHWEPDDQESFEDLDDARAKELRVPDSELAKAKRDNGFEHFTGVEWCLKKDLELFVAGRVEPRDPSGELVLDAAPALGRIELYPGKREALVMQLRGDSRGGKIMTVIFFLLGFLPPLVVFTWKLVSVLKARVPPSRSG